MQTRDGNVLFLAAGFIEGETVSGIGSQMQQSASQAVVWWTLQLCQSWAWALADLEVLTC